MQKNTLLKHFFRSSYFFVVFVFLISIDQFFKYKIRHSGGFYFCNKGISFGIKMPDIVFWLVLIIFFLIGMFFLQRKESFSGLFLLGLSFFIGGTLSNVVDRFFFGCVLDYITLFQKIIPVFNLADVGIFLGSCFVFFDLLPKIPSKSG